LPAESSTTATTVPLSTLAAPETWTGELIEVLASGVSMMIRPPRGIGVAAAPDWEVGEGLGLAPAAGDPEAALDALPEGEFVWSTNWV
jgi:hypothetical protein